MKVLSRLVHRIVDREKSFTSMCTFQCAINEGKIDANYIMCAHKDAVTGTVCPGIRGLYTWVKDHARYGRQASAGGVSEYDLISQKNSMQKITSFSDMSTQVNQRPTMSRPMFLNVLIIPNSS